MLMDETQRWRLIVKVIRADVPSAFSGPNIPCSYLVELCFEGKCLCTSVSEDAGCSPEWNEYLQFDTTRPGSHSLEARVYRVDETLLLLGTVQLAMDSFCLSSDVAVDMTHPWEGSGPRGALVLKVFLSDVDEVQRESWARNPLTDLWLYLGSGARAAGETQLVADSAPKEINPCFDLESGGVVEKMQYLFVHAVKARGLPDLDANGSLDPYVEVKLGDYRGVTKEVKRNKKPKWNAVFAFPMPQGGGRRRSVDVTVFDKDVVRDEFVGMVFFELESIPERSPNDVQLEPMWYQLLDHGRRRSAQGSLMLAVWIGSQADQAYRDAWISDTVDVAGVPMSQLQSGISPKVYYSPKVWYLQLTICEAQLSMTADDDDVFVEARVGRQEPEMTRVANKSTVTSSYVWNQEFVLVAAEGDQLQISVCTREGTDKVIGQTTIPLASLEKQPGGGGGRWFDLGKPALPPSQGAAMRIRLRSSLEAGDLAALHDGSASASAHHRDREDGVVVARLELGILGASGLTPVIKERDGRPTLDPYCVAKCGGKWVRTRTVIGTCDPVFNEQHDWDVHDTATVLTVGVFNNSRLLQRKTAAAGANLDTKIGMVRIRLSELQTGRIYAHSYPLFALSPFGPNKTGELRLAVRLSSWSSSSSLSSWIKMIRLYARPVAPPTSVPAEQSGHLRAQALDAVCHRLSRMEPPLRPEVVEHMCRVPTPHAWSLRRSKAHFFRLMGTLSGFMAAARWFRDVRSWRNPAATLLVHAGFLLALWFHRLVLPLLLLSLAIVAARNYRRRPTHPQHLDLRFSHAVAAHPDELDEEFDTFRATQPGSDVVRLRYDRLRSVASRVVTVLGDLVTQGERIQSLVSWRDPRATAIFQAFTLMAATTLWLVPLKLLLAVAGLYIMRHPRLRGKTPSLILSFFTRLPSRKDSLL